MGGVASVETHAAGAAHCRVENEDTSWSPLALAQALLVFDLSRTETFQSVLKWKREIDSKVTLPNGQPLPVFLLANKSDLPDTRIDKGAALFFF